MLLVYYFTIEWCYLHINVTYFFNNSYNYVDKWSVYLSDASYCKTRFFRVPFISRAAKI